MPRTTGCWFSFTTADLSSNWQSSNKSLKSERARAVRQAWKNEYNDVLSDGSGITRTWSEGEMEELLRRGKVSAYHGYHMKSVRRYPWLASDPSNIQFLTPNEHFKAHGGN